ncbi:MAG: SMP-30/gluconolactonase/LRE family protein [Sedimentisphaerales bacterium]|nr:SMP-30/gluconolactonase/LRE family protein [Sedimentisphaerales bacterium]
MQFAKNQNDNVCLNKGGCNNYWWMQLILPIAGMLFLAGLISSNLLSATAVADANEAKPKSIIAEGAQPKLVSRDYSFTEGPAVDKDGNIYFTDQPNDKILKWSVEDGSISVFLDKAGRANGMFFDKEGNLYACADEKNELWKIDKDGKVTVLVKDFEGKLLNGPNDLWISPLTGAIYFTDPMFARNYWTRSRQVQQEAGQQVYYISPDRKTVKRLTDDMRQPNGIVGTPDGKTLYVADMGANQTYKYTINEDGSISDKTPFCRMGSDGMTIDEQGNIYLTGNGGVTVFNSKGEQIEKITPTRGWHANVCFGGKDRKTLFITAGNSVFTLEMNVKGVQ